MELKREFTPKHNGNARRLAGLANAARGERVLWIVGVDEDTHQVVGAGEVELSDWWAGVASHFDELPPAMLNLSVPVQGTNVQALMFETDRAPFVVKTGTGGAITREVPWRESTQVDSVRRSDLLRMLTPLTFVPDFEILDLNFTVTAHNTLAQSAVAKASIYVLPRAGQRVVFPFHKVQIAYECKGTTHIISNVWLSVPQSLSQKNGGVTTLTSKTITESSSEIVVDGPGTFEVHASGSIPVWPVGNEPMRVTVHLTPAASSKTAVLSAEMAIFNYSSPFAVWKLAQR